MQGDGRKGDEPQRGHSHRAIFDAMIASFDLQVTFFGIWFI
jgi:hypothetical protein